MESRPREEPQRMVVSVYLRPRDFDLRSLGLRLPAVWVCGKGRVKGMKGTQCLFPPMAAMIPHDFPGPGPDSFSQKPLLFPQRKQTLANRQDLSLAFSWPHMNWDTEGSTQAQCSIPAVGSSEVSVWHQATQCQVQGSDSCIRDWGFASPELGSGQSSEVKKLGLRWHHLVTWDEPLKSKLPTLSWASNWPLVKCVCLRDWSTLLVSKMSNVIYLYTGTCYTPDWLHVLHMGIMVEIIPSSPGLCSHERQN